MVLALVPDWLRGRGKDWSGFSLVLRVVRPEDLLIITFSSWAA